MKFKRSYWWPGIGFILMGRDKFETDSATYVGWIFWQIYSCMLIYGGGGVIILSYLTK